MNAKQAPSPQEYAMILENIEDAVIALDPQGLIKLFNPAAQDYTGLSEKQSLVRDFFGLFSHQETLCYLTRTALTEGLVMASRNGVHFERWNEAFLRPGPQRPDTWLYGHQYIAWHAVETKSDLPHAPNELSLYASEGSWHGKGNTVRRYTLRMDGFVSVRAPLSGGELLTKPIVFDGQRLEINFSTSAAGSVAVEIQDADGKPLSNFSLAECHPQFGDELSRSVVWKSGGDVSGLAGKPVRLRFVLKDADLYSFRFAAEQD